MKTSFKNILKLAGCCMALTLVAFIRREDDPLGKLVTNLQHWTDSIPQEKVYLQMDRSYYALGDTLWFKGYLTVGAKHQLSALSGALYVELISEQDSLLQQLKLPVTAGMVMGNFILKDNYQTGNYRIRAYTQWMRNAGDDYFFDRTFIVGDIAGGEIVAKADFNFQNTNGKQALTALLNYSNDKGSVLADRDVHYEIWANHKALWRQSTHTDAKGNLQIMIPDQIREHPEGAYVHTIIQGADKNPVIRDFPVKIAAAQSDVQFFPESGSLINGISSRVAFKVLGTDGIGINAKGTVTDNDNKEVARIETLHAGMGNFLLNPQAGKTYTANLTFDDGKTQNVKLPAAADQGYVLSVYQPGNDSVLLRVQASANLLQSNLNIIAQSSGEVIFSSPIKIEKAMTSIWLRKKIFRTGITQFTLFNAAGEPLNERIAFIRNNDQMTLDLKSAKDNYNSKERVQIDLTARDGNGKPTFGNFSVSVVDESKAPADENKESSIFSNILLTSDLKGYVEQPNYYFNSPTEATNKALDNLMLTQGYRRFAWKDLNTTANTKPQYPVEQLGTVISGRVMTLNDKAKPVAGANISLVALRANVVKSATSDADGRFKFEPMFVTDSIKFSLQARTAKGSDKVQLIMDTIPNAKVNHNPNLADASLNIHNTLKQYLDNGKKQDEIYEKLGMLDKVQRLREVNIRAKKEKSKPAYSAPTGPYQIPDGHADKTFKLPNPGSCANLALCLQGMLPRVSFEAREVAQAGTTKFFPLYPMYRSGGEAIQLNLIVDGRLLGPIEAGDVLNDDDIDATEVVKIDYVFASLPLKSLLGGPAILIYTNRGLKKKFYSPSIANIDVKGFNKVREFYSPKYNRPGNAYKVPDTRTTVYWDPYLKTNLTGHTSFNFYNADGPGTYRVTVEGINAEGELGRRVYHYTVGGDQANFSAAISSASKSLARITDPVDSMNKNFPLEKVYLQTDKPYYNIGDTLWFKSYLLDGVTLTPSHRSGILYVEMDDDSTNVVRRISIPVMDGVGNGQIPLKQVIFKEGGYTLRAYTNWMQNFGGYYMFTQRFYLGIPSTKSWLVNSASTLQRVGNKDQLQAKLRLTRADDPTRPVAYKKVEVKVYDEWHYLSKQEMQTGADGSLDIKQDLGAKSDGRRIRVQITSLNKDDGYMITQVPLIVNRKQNVDVQFLPEGGNLIAGIKSVVGFKALAEDGHGVAVIGGIYDSKNNKVATFMPLHNGMGSFEFTPQPGETYKAQISEPVAKAFELPKIQKLGTVMHIDNPEQGDSLKIQIAGVQALRGDTACYLIGMARSVIYYSQKVDLNKPVITVAKKMFPTGVARLTLFKDATPLNERAVFIDNNDALSINIKTDKDTYLKRDSVGLDIEVKDKSGMPVQGSFSLAVTDDSQVKPDSLDNYGIATSLLLNADLRGNIEQPGYYINRKDKAAWQALDNLMLTQGWAGYDWQDVFAPTKSAKFKAEQPYMVTGRAINAAGNPLANKPVRITALRPPISGETQTDDNGYFTFKNLPRIDTGAYLLQAINDKGKVKSFGDVVVDRFENAVKPEPSSVLAMPWYVNTDSVELNFVKRKAAVTDDDIELTGRVLKEVKINSTKIIKESRNVFGPGGSDLVFDKKDIKESAATNLYDLLQQKLPGFKTLGYRTVLFRGEYINIPVLVFNGYSIDLRIDGWPLPLPDLDVTGEGPEIDLTYMSIKDVWAMPTGGAPMKAPNPPAAKGPLKGKAPDLGNHARVLGYNMSASDNENDAASSNRFFTQANTGGGRGSSNYSLRSDLAIEALKQIQIEGLTGLEVAYSARNTSRAGLVDFPWAHVELTTQSGAGWYRRTPPATTRFTPVPFATPKLFYSPRYNTEQTVKMPDYRPTVFWQPQITTDQNGHARLSFYTTDVQSKYTVKMAGIDNNGGLGDASIKIIPKNNNASMSTLKN